MYHVKLVKAHSYTGVIKATRENPDVFVKDKATADAAVATGYFTLVGEVEPESGSDTITGHLDREQLGKMKKGDLKKLADELGIDSSGLKTNSDYVDAIVSAEVTSDENAVTGDETDGSGDNEADFGEGE